MRISFLALAMLLAVSVTPTFAKGGTTSHASSGSHGNAGEQHGGQPHNNGGQPQHGGNNEHQANPPQHVAPPNNGGQRGGFGPVQHGNDGHFDRDRAGHNFHREDFGRNHFTRFSYRDGRWYGGRHEFFFGGFWFAPYYGVWPGWFYNCNTYFDIGPDGYWYAYCYDNPGFSFRINID